MIPLMTILTIMLWFAGFMLTAGGVLQSSPFMLTCGFVASLAAVLLALLA